MTTAHATPLTAALPARLLAGIAGGLAGGVVFAIPATVDRTAGSEAIEEAADDDPVAGAHVQVVDIHDDHVGTTADKPYRDMVHPRRAQLAGGAPHVRGRIVHLRGATRIWSGKPPPMAPTGLRPIAEGGPYHRPRRGHRRSGIPAGTGSLARCHHTVWARDGAGA